MNWNIFLRRDYVAYACFVAIKLSIFFGSVLALFYFSNLDDSVIRRGSIIFMLLVLFMILLVGLALLSASFFRYKGIKKYGQKEKLALEAIISPAIDQLKLVLRFENSYISLRIHVNKKERACFMRMKKGELISIMINKASNQAMIFDTGTGSDPD